jgi:hypothetical protein
MIMSSTLLKETDNEADHRNLDKNSFESKEQNFGGLSLEVS